MTAKRKPKPKRRKPREWWIVQFCDGVGQDAFDTLKEAQRYSDLWPGGEVIRVREVPR